MEIGKVRKLLALIFAVLAVIFYVLYKRQLDAISVLSDEFVVSAVENLNSKGIEIDSETVEKQIPDKDIYLLENSEPVLSAEVLVEKINGFVFGNSVNTVRFETPDGVSFGVFDSTVENKEVGRILLNSDESRFEFSKDGYYGLIDDELIYGDNGSVDKAVASVIDKLYKTLCTTDELEYRISGCKNENGILLVSLIQTIEEYDITDCYLNFAFKNGEIVSVCGNVLSGTPVAKYHNTLVDGINVLYELDGKNVSKIKREELVYLVRKTVDNRCYLVPGWKIVSIDKSGNEITQYFDAL